MERKAAKRANWDTPPKQNVANPFRISYRDKYRSVMCVYKIWVDDRYFIGSAKALKQHMEHLSIGIDRRLRNGLLPSDIYYDLIVVIKETNVQVIEVEVVSASVSGYDMLKSCYDELQKAKVDPMCINKTFEPYIPSWVPNGDKERVKSYIISFNNKK